MACLSHLILSEAAVKKPEDSYIELIIGTDSVENSYIVHSDKIKVVSVAPLFGEVISRIHKRESVSPLFEKVPVNLISSVY